MLMRAKTVNLFEGSKLTYQQEINSRLNLQELEEGKIVLDSYPRRLVLELTNLCNLNCIMCGRNSAEFKPTIFSMDTFKSLEYLMDYVEEVTLMGWGEPTIHPNFNEMLHIINNHHTRKYFCTNGMNLRKIREAIFKNHVEVFAVSVDGACQETNARIRRGSDLASIIKELRCIVDIKKEMMLDYPYINFVFCAMKSNISELPDLIRLAADIGIDEVKVVYLTIFDQKLVHESLWGEEELIYTYFSEAERLGEELGINIKLPHFIGEDIAGSNYHKDCFVAWRDFFLGSDGYVRPCMSTPVKFFRYNQEIDFMKMWNSAKYQRYRQTVNDYESCSNPCIKCYQSSFCNWNKKESFIQIGESFSPEWIK